MTSRRARRHNMLGVALMTAAIVWTFVAASDEEGSRPWPTVGAWLLAGSGVALGRRLGRRTDAVATSAATALLGGALLGSLVALQRPSAGGPPLGYGNANAALFALIGLAAALVRARASALTRASRLATTGVGFAAIVACLASGSTGTVAALATGAGVAGGALWLRRPWVAVSAAGIVLVLGLALTMAAAARADRDAAAADSVSVRARLWQAAVDFAEDHPVSGIGPGRFQDVNPVSTDADLRRAHSTPLQVAAEQGTVGLLLVLGAVGWALRTLWTVALRAGAAIGSAVMITVGLLACWDWVLAEPAVLGSAAVLIGAASQRGEQATRQRIPDSTRAWR